MRRSRSLGDRCVRQGGRGVTTPHALHPGHYATYRPADHVLDRRVRVVVRGVHHDGTVTVETVYELDEDGKCAGRFLGDTITLDAEELTQ